MRLNINLASQPFVDSRRFWLQWGSGLAVLAIFSLALLYTVATGWRAASRDRHTIAQTREAIARCDRERAQAEATLSKPENRVMREQSEMLNQLILRKSFSWTRVFTDLEKLMPPQLRVVSIAPETSPDSGLAIKLTVAGQSRERALELVHHLEESPQFERPLIREEVSSQGQTPGDAVQFQVSAHYVVAPPRSQR